MNRILIVQQNWLGDALFATPAVRAVRRRYKDAHIACLGPERVKTVWTRNPHVNEVIVYDDRAPVFSPSFWKTVLELRKKNFDAAIFFHGSATKARLVRWAGIRERWGYGEHAPLTRRAPYPETKPHKVDYFLGLVDALGMPPDGRLMEFHPSDAAPGELKELFESRGLSMDEPYAVVHAGGNWDMKRWPSDYFSQWVYLFLRGGHGKVILCGTDSEQRTALEIARRFSPSEVISLCGKTSLDALALMLKNARLLLSNDSGPIHLAASQGTPIVGVYGPTSAAETGPVTAGPLKIVAKNVGCRVPCYYRSCNYRVCLDLVLPQEVWQESRKILEASAAAAGAR